MEKQPHMKTPPESPLKEANIPSLLTFWWLNGLFRIGAQRPLEASDLYPLPPDSKTQPITEKLQELWNKQKTQCETSGNQPRLWKSVVKAVAVRNFLLLLFSGLLDSVCRIIQPLLVGFLISQLMLPADSGRPWLYMYLCAVSMFVAAVIKSICQHQCTYHSVMLGMRLRSALKGLVYLKILRLGQQTLRDFTTGQVIDLLSNDVQRMEQAPKMFIRSLTAIFDIAVTTILMWFFVGGQPFYGLLFLFVLIPLAGLLSYIGGGLRQKTASVSDRRILLMNEVVSAIRTVKINAWEWIYQDKINKIRREEINVIRQKSLVLSTLNALYFISGAFAVFIAILAMSLAQQLLSPVNVFTVVAFMNVLRISVSLYFGFGVQFVIEAVVSVDRIQTFLELHNLPSVSKSGTLDKSGNSPSTTTTIQQEKSYKDDQKEDNTFYVSNLAVRSNESKYIFRNINFTAKQGSLVVLSGPVGSGKSTLIAAINQEAEISEGVIHFPGKIAYVSQSAWIFPGTIRENILFGTNFAEERYNAVIEACALERDMKILPEGDNTIVGQQGASLSGGQQARISLARAVYADADVYLLDDPLSAVDAKVGRHIFQKCVCGLLSTKTRLFVTYQTSFMKMADQIILLGKGQVLCKGTYSELKESGVLTAVLEAYRRKTPSFQEIEMSTKEEDGKEKEVEGTAEGVSQGLKISDEDRSVGTVSFKLYWRYFKAGMPTVAVIGLGMIFLMTQVLSVALDVWLSHVVNESREFQGSSTSIAIYAGMAGVAVVFALIRAFLFFVATLNSSQNLHQQMSRALLKAPALFFDTNPVGRILNRFSKDVGNMDEILPYNFLYAIQLIFQTIASILLPSLLNFWVFLAVLPVLLLGTYLVRYYLQSSREMKRLECIARSPVFSHISETLNGLDTIRSRKRHRDYIQMFYSYQDKHNQAFALVTPSVQWMGVRVDFLCSLFIGAVAMSSVFISQDAAKAGLALVYVIEIIEVAQFTVVQCSEVENQMTSVERVMTYTEIESEPGYNIETEPPRKWPRNPEIKFFDVSLRYHKGGPRVLKNLSLRISGKAKIGVVGRTGAGKSSLISALLRMPEADGAIMIDGVDLRNLNLQDSRKRISVLSQKPVLFSGSLRRNIDPLDEYGDIDLWRVLEVVQLKSLVNDLDGQLDFTVSEGGGNFSIGEQQLLCLARVLLQRNKILVLDEPTAHVDPITEKTIQATVREQLKECTVITVAHRLNTIRDSDKIIVMKAGRMVEYDTYEELLKKEGGVFAEMAKKLS